ncbi:MAG: aminoacyl-tRNA hydrolase [Candidatus Cloacimonas sp.]|jgi:PTH1 family peptidyl-tRNA hydrolase|nr:aminoacyl-tRNA hydrolase [Candidatus Cloacimonadota bacterium]
MKLVVGLGNPGKEYANNRHNAGFFVLDDLADRLGTSFTKSKGYTYAKAKDALLLKPMTYMNRSGEAVLKVCRQFEIGSILVVYDDVSIPLGELRIRANGSAGGHNGVSSIISAIGDPNFYRLRFGIGNTPYSDLSDYVLSNFRKSEVGIVNEMKIISAELIERYLEFGYSEMVNHYSVNKVSYSERIEKFRDQRTKGGNK